MGLSQFSVFREFMRQPSRFSGDLENRGGLSANAAGVPSPVYGPVYGQKYFIVSP